MTKPEFNRWLRHHRGLFPVGMGEWLAKIPEKGSPDAPGRRDVLAGWASILSDVALADAEAASMAMARGDLPEPMGYDRHPRAIREHALKLADARQAAALSRPQANWRDGEPTFKCPLCRDYGTLFIWHPDALRAAKAGEPWQAKHGQPVGVRCSCERGQRAKALPEFNPRYMVATRGANEWEWPDLVAAMEKFGPAHPENYEPAFAEYAGEP